MAEKVRIQDDLYRFVNGEWIDKAVIPDDKPSVGGFVDLDQDVEKLLMSDFDAFREGKKTTDIEEFKEAIKLYNKIVDVKRRNEEGIKPTLPILERIKSIKTVDDLNKNLLFFVLNGIPLPFECGVTEDMADATKHAFVMLGPSIILPDTTYYKDNNPQGQALLGMYADMVKKLLAYTPLNESEQAKVVEDMLKFDSLVAQEVKSQVEWADYTNNHNPMNIDEVSSYLNPIDIKAVLSDVYQDKAPNTIVVYDPKAIKNFNHYFNEDNLEMYVNWAYAKALVNNSSQLSEEIAFLGGTYRRALMGLQTDPVVEKQAYRMVSSVFSEPIGVYYGRTYFGEEAKKDVVNMVHKIIETYKVRVRNNKFLQEKTKDKAILKLSTIEVKMGYPDFIHDYYKNYKVNNEDSYFESLCKIRNEMIKHSMEELNKPVDRTEWAMPGHMVNAAYNPSANDITFPAAILQKPFYSINQSASQNLGGIGAVIGHEISHAFDNNGAKFDENGNLNNWWTDSDFAEFKKLTQAMIEQFDGIEIYGGKVNGELVVSENIADNGGVAVTLEIMKNLEGANYQEYFMNWARVWCRKAREQYAQLLLARDVHSPAELRANIQPRNFKEWYEAFDVKETDQMFIPENKRIIIW